MTLNKQSKTILAIASLLIALAICFGAFGAHALKDILTPKYLEIYHTGVEYQFYNTLGLFALGLIANFTNRIKKIIIAFYFILVGTIIFSGSLYLLTILDKPILGAITPIGGTAQIIGWLILFFALIKE